jgi:hypothetical protein
MEVRNEHTLVGVANPVWCIFHRCWGDALRVAARPAQPDGLDVRAIHAATLHTISGAAEILGGLGLILPAVTRIQTRLLAWAAAGLALVMLAASIWHIPRGEYMNIALTLVNAGVMGFIAYGRARLAPLSERGAANL